MSTSKMLPKRNLNLNLEQKENKLIGFVEKQSLKLKKKLKMKKQNYMLIFTTKKQKLQQLMQSTL